MKTDKNVLETLIHYWSILKIYLYTFHKKREHALDCIFCILEVCIYFKYPLRFLFEENPLGEKHLLTELQ